jgi:hypothetical protein
MPPIPRLARLDVEDVQRAAAVVRYVADNTPGIEEFDRLADLLAICADVYEEERRRFEQAKTTSKGRD